MVTAEIENCESRVKFIPKVIYPGKYYAKGRCFLMERVTKSNQPVTVQINGEGNDKLSATCQDPNCPLRKTG
jgi:hypothetical protein